MAVQYFNLLEQGGFTTPKGDYTFTYNPYKLTKPLTAIELQKKLQQATRLLYAQPINYQDGHWWHKWLKRMETLERNVNNYIHKPMQDSMQEHSGLILSNGLLETVDYLSCTALVKT